MRKEKTVNQVCYGRVHENQTLSVVTLSIRRNKMMNARFIGGSKEWTVNIPVAYWARLRQSIDRWVKFELTTTALEKMVDEWCAEVAVARDEIKG